jgi:hypothetical protein
MKNLLRVTSIALIAIFIAATCQAQEYRGTGRQGYGNNMYTKSNHGNRHGRGYYDGHGRHRGHGRGYYGGHGYYGGGYGYRGYGYNDDAALITGILVGGSIINNMISQPSAPPPEATTCRKSTTTTWENGRQVGTNTTENCEGYRNTTRY